MIELQIPFEIRYEDENSVMSMTKNMEKQIETMIENTKSIADTELACLDKDELFQYINNLYKEPLQKFAETGLNELVRIYPPNRRGNWHGRDPYLNRKCISYIITDDSGSKTASGEIATDWNQRANSKWIYKEIWIKETNIKDHMDKLIRKEEWRVKE